MIAGYTTTQRGHALGDIAYGSDLHRRMMVTVCTLKASDHLSAAQVRDGDTHYALMSGGAGGAIGMVVRRVHSDPYDEETQWLATIADRYRRDFGIPAMSRQASTPLRAAMKCVSSFIVWTHENSGQPN